MTVGVTGKEINDVEKNGSCKGKSALGVFGSVLSDTGSGAAHDSS